MNIGFDEFAGCVPTVEFEYPEDGDQPAPVVRDEWIEAPLMRSASSGLPSFPAAT